MSGGPVRQLSLHLPPSTKSGGPLRKQRSVDADRPWTSAGCNSGLRVTASSILTGGHFPQEAVITRSTSGRGAVARPRAVKVAWTDHRQEDSENVEVVVKRCTGQPRPVTCKPHLPSIGCDKDTILYTRQQLAERLRRAWLEREHSGRSLDIFLAHSNLESKEEEEEDSSADTKQSPSRVAEDRSLSASRNSVRYSKCAKKNAFPCAQNNLNSTLYISNAVGVSKNTPLKKNSAAFLRTSLSAQQCGTGVGKGEGDVLLARAPDEQEPVGAHNAAGDTPQIEVQGPRSSGLATIEITSSSAFRNADTAVSSNDKVQNHKNVEVNKSEVNPSKESAASSDKRNVETLARDVPRAINSHSSSRLCDAAEERDRGTEAVEVFSPRGKGSFSADSVRPGEASGNQRTEDEQERDVRANREETKQSNEVCVMAVSDKESCKLVQPPRARVTSTADVTPATARRVNYRNSLNNTITGSFSSDIPPSTKVCSSAPAAAVTRSPATRALSATPGRSILVQRNKRPPLQRGVGVDMSDDGEEADKGTASQSVAPTRRRARTAEPRRRMGAWQRPGEDIVTMVSLLSDTSDQEADPTGPFAPHAPWLEGRDTVGQNQGGVVAVKKPSKSVSFQESLPTPPRPSAAPPPVTRRVLPATSSEEKKAVPAPARDTSIKTPGRETSRQKATSILQNTRSQVEPCPGNAEENCNDDQHDCAETAPSAAAEESHAGPARTPSETHSTGVGSTAPRCVSKPSADPAEVVAIPEDVEPEFQTPKERECWQLYRRMMEKGVSVSYDTVLRGLLTPTEYRLRRTC